MRFYITIAVISIAVLAGLFTIGGSFYTVGVGERAVLTRFGAITSDEGPGLHFKTPFIEGAQRVNIQPRTDRETLNSYSSDQQLGDLTASITYSVNAGAVQAIVATYGNEQRYYDRIVSPRFSQEFKAVFGRYTAADAVTKRDQLAIDVLKAMAASMGDVAVIQSVQVENIKFSEAFDKALEERKSAEIQVLKAQQKALEAKVSAEITLTQAKAAAESVRMAGLAEADAIRAKSDALKQSPEIAALTAAQKWDGHLPQTMVPGSTVPFLSVR